MKLKGENTWKSMNVIETIRKNSRGIIKKIRDNDGKVYIVKELQALDLPSLKYIINFQNINRYIDEAVIVKISRKDYLRVPVFDWIVIEGGKSDTFNYSLIKILKHDLYKYIRQLITQLVILHEAGIYHNDIKPSNILYDSARDQLILFDFDCSIVDTVYNYEDPEAEIEYGFANDSQSSVYRPIECFRETDRDDPEFPVYLACIKKSIAPNDPNFPNPSWEEYSMAKDSFTRKITDKSDIYALGCTVWSIFNPITSPEITKNLLSMIATSMSDRPNTAQLHQIWNYEWF